MYQACIKVILGCCLAFGLCAAENIVFKEGEHYEKVDLSVLAQDSVKQHIAQDKNKVQVIEFFSYGCYWCGQVHAPLAKWATTKQDVAMYHYPAVFNSVWRDMGRVYLSVQQLDNSLEIDQAIFTAVHTKHLRVWEEKVIKTLITEHGGNVEVFAQYYDSFVIQSKLKKSEDLANAYKVDATPYVIVHGPYASYITSLSKTRDKDTLVQVVDYLVMREQKIYQPVSSQS